MSYVIIKNKKTGEEYNVSNETWNTLKANNQHRKFKLIGEVKPIKVAVPSEVQATVKKETKPKQTDNE